MRPSETHGFTLVELSIVLVILGLLTGGILTGQSLIRAAELRSVTTEYQKYQSAIQIFRARYLNYPGDMPNATAFWGVAAGNGTGTDTPCVVSSNFEPPTCNGNGNGSLGHGSNAVERGHFFKHLANAGLVEGAYAGYFSAPVDQIVSATSLL